MTLNPSLPLWEQAYVRVLKTEATSLRPLPLSSTSLASLAILVTKCILCNAVPLSVNNSPPTLNNNNLHSTRFYINHFPAHQHLGSY